MASSAVPATASTAGLTASSSTALTPSATSYAPYSSSSMYGGSMYGRSMYGAGYGGSMYGGGYGSYGGYGSSMYGRYGSSYGSSYGGGMYGQRQQQDSEFFAPKQPETGTSTAGRLTELTELNTTFLDSLHSYGEGMWRFVQRLLLGCVRLRQAVRDGTVPPAVARRAASLAITVAAICTAALARGALQRRQRRLAWEAAFRSGGAAFPFGFPGLPLAAL